MIAHEPRIMTLPQALSHLRDHGYAIHADGVYHKWQIIGHGRDETDDLYSAADVIDFAQQVADAGPVVDDDEDEARDADIADDEQPVLIQVGLVRTDTGAQHRAEMDTATVEQYEADMRRQGKRYRFPAILAYFDGEWYWLADGLHRVTARRNIGYTTILAIVRQGTRRDAQKASLSANTNHGLPLQPGDRRRKVEFCLFDEEWTHWSDREIARRCCVDHSYVSRIRRDLKAAGALPDAASSVRTYERDGRTHTMNTTAIGTSVDGDIAATASTVPTALDDQSTIRLPDDLREAGWLLEPAGEQQWIAINDDMDARTHAYAAQAIVGKIREEMQRRGVLVVLPRAGIPGARGLETLPANASVSSVVALYRRGDLIVHRSLPSVGSGYTISHVPTGLGVVCCDTRDAATTCLDRLIPLALWHELDVTRAPQPLHAAFVAERTRLFDEQLARQHPGAPAEPPAPAPLMDADEPDDAAYRAAILDDLLMRTPPAITEAYASARAVQDHDLRASLFCIIDAVVDGQTGDDAQSIVTAPPPQQEPAPAPQQEPAPARVDPVPADLPPPAPPHDRMAEDASLAGRARAEVQAAMLSANPTTIRAGLWTAREVAQQIDQDDHRGHLLGEIDRLLSSVTALAGKSATDRRMPIVPHVLIVEGQNSPYTLPKLVRAEVRYHTSVRMRIVRADGSESTIEQKTVTCLPDEAAWAEVQAAHHQYQAALTELADLLREIGSYPRRLAAAGGAKKSPINPLSPTVISAVDPDQRDWSAWTPWNVPEIRRKACERHTELQLQVWTTWGTSGYFASSGQHNHFICPDDATWERVSTAHAVVVERHGTFLGLLDRLGTYTDAVADGRYDGLWASRLDLDAHSADRLRYAARRVILVEALLGRVRQQYEEQYWALRGTGRTVPLMMLPDQQMLQDLVVDVLRGMPLSEAVHILTEIMPQEKNNDE